MYCGRGSTERKMACLQFLLSFTLLWVSSCSGTPLDDYVNAPDPTYEFRDLGYEVGMKGYTVYFINMTSQTWLSADLVSCSVWWHTLVVTIPDKLLSTDSAFLYVTGGSNDHYNLPDVTDVDVLFSSILSFSTGIVSATLFQIPNEPCIFSEDTVMNHKRRTEDAIIAFTWYHFLMNSGKPEYLLRLPMTKAVVRAMDTITTFVKQKIPTANITKFGVAGASKRGWTTWTTGAVDKRVIALVPIVEDALNLQKNLHHMYRAYGGWTFAFKDYVDLNVTANLDSPNMTLMSAIIDPYAYRDRLLMPKLIINSGGDEFFLPDDNHYFWEDLTGPKYLRMVPNAEHSLANRVVSVVLGIRAFFLSVIMDIPMPKLSWTMESNSLGGSITFTSDTTPTEVHMHFANTLSAERRDFRLLKGPDPKHPTVQPVLWFSRKLEQSSGSYTANMSVPTTGWTAFFIEAYFPGPNGSVLDFTSQVNIIPDKFPFPDCSGKNCSGKLV